jgi:hypothetical protein
MRFHFSLDDVFILSQNHCKRCPPTDLTAAPIPETELHTNPWEGATTDGY